MKKNDWVLISAVLLVSAFGLIMVYSASYVFAFDEFGNHLFFFKKQMQWLIISLVLFVFFMMFSYRWYERLSKLIVLLSVILLIMVLSPWFGVEIKGAQRWIDLGPMNLQPSEFVKLGMIIYLARVYSRKQSYIDDLLRGVLPPLFVVGIIFILIMGQPDLGTAGAILAVAGLIVFCSGARIIHLALLALMSVSIVGVLAVLEPYRLSRLTGFSDPFADQTDTGFQLIQSYIAIAHGGVTGAGFGQSVQKLLYLPEAHTDFILAIVSEELGLLGVLFYFLCISTIVVRGTMIGVKCQTPFGSLLAYGISFQLAFQVIMNVGAVSGLLPITGIPLPFMSYGGSSLMITFISVGILANIARQNAKVEQKIKLREAG